MSTLFSFVLAQSRLPGGTKSWRSESRTDTKAPSWDGSFGFPHSAVRDAHLLLLDTASVQREHALNTLWTRFLLLDQSNNKSLHVSKGDY